MNKLHHLCMHDKVPLKKHFIFLTSSFGSFCRKNYFNEVLEFLVEFNWFLNAT